jgi:multidrug efflux pump subunit AcrB
MSKLISFFIRQRLFGDLISIFTILSGVLALTQIQREVFPNVSFEVVSVETLMPGASPEELEKLVSSPLEQDLKEVDGIKKMQSYSSESRSYLVLFLDPDQTTEDKAKSDVQTVVDAFQKPDQAEDPKVAVLESKQQPIVEVTLSSDIEEMKLRNMARQLEKKIEAIKGVGRVVFKGLRDMEIRIQADPRKLAQNSVSLDELILGLKLQNVSIPAGKLDPDPTQTQKSERIVRTIGEFKSLQDIENTVLRGNEFGQAVRVKDVAKVFYDLEETTVLNRANGKPAITLTVLKKEKADAITVVAELKKVVADYQKTTSEPFYVAYINDFSLFIERRLSVLSSNLAFGLVLVLVMLTFFLPFRVALIVSSGIVISFLGCMLLFQLFGYSLNLLSLLGLIIVSGMLVDDAIVVSENISRYMRMGFTPEEAATKGTAEIWPAVTASVLTTVVAFLPMMFMSGIFGKFVWQIPLGVVAALSVSLLESIFIVPQHFANFVTATAFVKPLQPSGFAKIRWRFSDWWEEKVTIAYGDLLRKIIRNRYKVVLSLAGALVVVAIVSSQILKFILFPPDGVEIFFIRVKAPTGTTLQETVELIKPIEKRVSELAKNELNDYTATVGLIQQDPNDPNTKRGVEYAQVTVFLSPQSSRERTAEEIRLTLQKEIGEPPGIEQIWYDRINTGPPVGKPISLDVQGENYEDILPAVRMLEKEIATIDGVTDVANSYVQGKPEIHIKIKGTEAISSGLSATAIGSTMRAAIDGVIATSIRELDQEIDLRVILDNAAKSPREIVSQLQIPNNRGNLIPLLSVADLVETRGVSLMEHLNNTRVVKVQANVNLDKISALAANDRIRKEFLEKIQLKFPKIKIGFGGEDEDTQESLASLGRAFLFAFMAIFLILILTFRNLYQPFLVILTIPVGVVAVLLTLVIFGMPLSFMACLGVIALAGVIVNNAIVLIDFVNLNRAQGGGLEASLVEGAKARLRPIFLTTATTVVGLLPTAHGIGGEDPFVVPIAMSLGYGLLIGSIITAFVFPAAIAITDDAQGWLSRKFARAA